MPLRPCPRERLRPSAGDPTGVVGSSSVALGRTHRCLPSGTAFVVEMGLTQYYTATSLDGFIADENHSLEWLFTRQQDRNGPLNYAEFVADVGAVAMGATTYDWILDHEFAGKDPTDWKWSYDVPSWVFTHRELRTVPGARIEFVQGDVE